MNIIRFIKSYSPYLRKIVVYKHKNKTVIQSKIDISFKRISSLNYIDASNWLDEKTISLFKLNLQHDELYGVFGYNNNKVIAYGWIVFNKTRTVKKVRNYLPIEPDSAYIEGCAVNPEYRDKKIYQSMLCYMIEVINSHFIQSIYVDTDFDNKSAIRAFENTGFRRILLLTVLSIRSHFLFTLNTQKAFEKDYING